MADSKQTQPVAIPAEKLTAIRLNTSLMVAGFGTTSSLVADRLTSLEWHQRGVLATLTQGKKSKKVVVPMSAIIHVEIE